MPSNSAGFSVSTLSRRLGHSRRSLSNWLREVEPCGTEGGHPVYRLADVERAIAASMQRSRVATTGREKLVNLQCEKLAFQISVLKRDYVAVTEVEADIAAMIQQARRVLETAPTSLAPQVVGLSITDAQRLIREWVHDALTQLHNDPLGTANQPSQITA